MCCRANFTPNWATILRNGTNYQKYVVRIWRQPQKCCDENRCQIFVNDQELLDHELNYNGCSPICCMKKGGSYEWEQDGHRFLLMLDKLSWGGNAGKYRLFVDGIDVESRQEFSSFWRRKAMTLLLVGSIPVIAFALILGLIYGVFELYNFNSGSFSIMYWLVGYGIYFIIAGIIILIRYSTPRASPYDVLDYKADQARVV